MSSFAVMQLEKMMAYVESVLIMSLFVQCANESPGTYQKKKNPTTSSPVALQREMGMAGNSLAGSSSPPGISIQLHQQGQNPQRWPLASVCLCGSSPWFTPSKAGL